MFFEVQEPYYALIKCDQAHDWVKIYEDNVCAIDVAIDAISVKLTETGTKNVGFDYAMMKYVQAIHGNNFTEREFDSACFDFKRLPRNSLVLVDKSIK